VGRVGYLKRNTNNKFTGEEVWKYHIT